jgi:hypothetical protein
MLLRERHNVNIVAAPAASTQRCQRRPTRILDSHELSGASPIRRTRIEVAHDLPGKRTDVRSIDVSQNGRCDGDAQRRRRTLALQADATPCARGGQGADAGVVIRHLGCGIVDLKQFHDLEDIGDRTCLHLVGVPSRQITIFFIWAPDASRSPRRGDDVLGGPGKHDVGISPVVREVWDLVTASGAPPQAVEVGHLDRTRVGTVRVTGTRSRRQRTIFRWRLFGTAR